MDNATESWRAKVLIVAVGAFLISCIFVYSDLMYLIDSREATAVVTESYQVEKRGRFGVVKGHRLAIEYRFTDVDGRNRTGRDDVRSDWQIPANGKLQIRYRQGEDGASRLAGQSHWGAIIIFVVCLTAVGIFGYRLWKEAQQAYEPKYRRKE